jgi:hypothetical protein
MGAPQIFENLIQAKRLHSLSAPAPRMQDNEKTLQIVSEGLAGDKVQSAGKKTDQSSSRPAKK